MAGNRTTGTPAMAPDPTGSAADEYSWKRASPAQSSMASPARTAGPASPWASTVMAPVSPVRGGARPRGYRRPVADPRIQVPPNCELTLGMTCVDKAEPGRTVWRMRADERFANPAGIVQGGFLGAMADSAMGSAAVTFARGAGRRVFASNVEMKTSFLAAARVGSVLECTARIVTGGARVAFAEAEVVDDGGRVVARASSTYLYTERT